ncbi:MAG: sulfatase-like hydrolase/transferase [Phycisphaera sp.]|nr:sulfatase-like hydrolase/transferase [Phycisphaera sp.]
MSRFAWITLCVMTLFCAAVARPAVAADKPNILFIFADDLCYETVGAYGMEDVKTPNIDKLVQRGTTFTHAYNMGAWTGAVCVSSRTMLNTGRFLWHAHKLKPDAERQSGQLWSEQMKKAGYDTYMTGKWHVSTAADKAFDHTGHVRGGMPKQTPTGYNRPLADGTDPWDPSDPKFGGYWEGGKHWSEVVGDETLDFLDNAKKADKPFFMYIAFNAAHDPRQSPGSYLDMYPVDKIKVPVNFLPEYPYCEVAKTGHGLRDEKLAPFPRTEREIQVHRHEYFALISHMDNQIGRILDALEKSGKADNTWIIFTADHGLAVGHHGLLGKQNMYDDSVRVPFTIVGPGVPAGKRFDTRIYLQDAMATTLEIAGVDKPDWVQFNSVLPVIKGQRKTQYDAIYGAYLDAQRMVTLGDYKLILYPNGPVARLYNLKDDPYEMNDLAKDPKFASTIRELFAELLKLQQQTGDNLDLKKAYPDL